MIRTKRRIRLIKWQRDFDESVLKGKDSFEKKRLFKEIYLVVFYWFYLQQSKERIVHFGILLEELATNKNT